MRSNSQRIKDMTFVAIFVAIISVISQISFPTPSAVPITLQTLIIPFTGYYLGIKRATISILIYIMLGLIGVPVFASFQGGLYVILGPTGGFIWGFLIIVILCSLFAKTRLAIPVGISSMFLCHIAGIFQYTIVMKTSPWAAIISVSFPYIVKDIIFVLLAYFLSSKIQKRIQP